MPPVIPPPPLPAGGDDRFHFSPGNANPELWATTIPLVVVHRCRRHKGLIATWRAIHWLIVLHSRSGRADFGVREIAEEADVGRNELCDTHDKATGEVVKKGYISILCDARLIDIIGQVTVPGGRKPRNIYSVDLARLIAESALLAPEVLRTYGAATPPRPQMHSDQLTFFGLMERESDRIKDEVKLAGAQDRQRTNPAEAQWVMEGSGASASVALNCPETGPATEAYQSDRPENGTDECLSEGPRPENGIGAREPCPENGTAAATLVSDWPDSGTELALPCPENGTVSDQRLPTRPENEPGFSLSPLPRSQNGTPSPDDRPGIGTGKGRIALSPNGSRTDWPETGTEQRAAPSRNRDVGGMDGDRKSVV